MNNIQILDCTLRDGGYVNDWRFGKYTIKSVIDNLTKSKIDIIECGFLADIEYDVNCTRFSDVEQLKKFLPEYHKNVMFVGMIALGKEELHYDKIPVCDNKSLDGIRITFHQYEIEKAVEFAKNLMGKGYKVFMQPVGTMTYTDMELIRLIEIINNLKPFAFYLVDTLGSMYKNDLLRMFYLVDNNLDFDINIGFHSHNNLQLSFSNAQELMKLHTKRQIIIDSSVFGMGRGAGNLCSELITQYVNDNIAVKYDVVPLLRIIDEHLTVIKAENPWGYTAPYYIAAVHCCHPDYASFLMNKQTLSINDIDKIIQSIPTENRGTYDKDYIKEAYVKYQEHYIDDKESLEKLKDRFSGKNILLLGPGKTIYSEQDKIKDIIAKENPIIITVNFVSDIFNQDYVYISNLKRFDNLEVISPSIEDNYELIITSNITTEKKDGQFIINYKSYTIDDDNVFDNAGLMAMQFICKCNPNTIYLAGFDGFSDDNKQNYFSVNMVNNVEIDVLNLKNESMKYYINKILSNYNYEFITTSSYIEK